MIIYKTTNLVTGKMYVGQSKYNNPEYFGSGKLIRQSISKHGVVNFTKEILETCDNFENMNILERFWIKKLNTLVPSGYNIHPGGQGGDTITTNANRLQICKTIKAGIAKSTKIRKPVSENTKRKLSKKIIVDNIEYESVTHASKILKVSHATVSRKLYLSSYPNYNFVDTSKYKPQKNKDKPTHKDKKLIYYDVEYRSLCYASRILGISRTTMMRRIHDTSETEVYYI